MAAAKKGVWGGKNFQKPWDYRKEKKAQGAANAQAKRDAAAAKKLTKGAVPAGGGGAVGADDDDAPFEE